MWSLADIIIIIIIIIIIYLFIYLFIYFYLKVLGLSIPILKSHLYPELLERLFATQRWDSMLPLVPSNQVLLVLIRMRL